MFNTTECFQLQRISQAERFSALAQDIRDAVVDSWHTPAAIRASSTRAVKTQLECAMDPDLLRDLSTSMATAGMSSLVHWLKDKGVEYVIGYRVMPAHQSAVLAGHRLALKLTWGVRESSLSRLSSYGYTNP